MFNDCLNENGLCVFLTAFTLQIWTTVWLLYAENSEARYDLVPMCLEYRHKDD